ncbi:hypothetical protein AB1N83_007231 [Pleurotus pulmonarius]
MPCCSDCHRAFVSLHSLFQHCRDKLHGQICAPCRRIFISDTALNMHLRDSPRHPEWIPPMESIDE